MKLHIGSGTVYLKDWLNVEPAGDHVFYPYERPDLVERYSADESNYYGRHSGQSLNKFVPAQAEAELVCDVKSTWQDLYLNFPAQCAGEILSRQTFEHFDTRSARFALLNSNYVLRSGGKLRIDVPDNHETMERYRETGDKFYVRHLVGPAHKGSWGHHVMSYTREELKSFVEDFGFKFEAEEPNIHLYPAFCLRFYRV